MWIIGLMHLKLLTNTWNNIFICYTCNCNEIIFILHWIIWNQLVFGHPTGLVIGRRNYWRLFIAGVSGFNLIRWHSQLNFLCLTVLLNGVWFDTLYMLAFVMIFGHLCPRIFCKIFLRKTSICFSYIFLSVQSSVIQEHTL